MCNPRKTKLIIIIPVLLAWLEKIFFTPKITWHLKGIFVPHTVYVTVPFVIVNIWLHKKTCGNVLLAKSYLDIHIFI